MSVDITIIKRDGRREPLDITKIQKMTSEAVADLSGVSQSEIELDARIKFIDGMKSSDIQDALIKTAVEKIDIDVPNWTFVAARLRLYDLYHEVGKVLGNVKGNSYGPLQTTIDYGIAQNRYKKDLCDGFDVEDLSDYIKPERDLQFTYLGIKTAIDKYLTRDALGQTFELPQHLFMMIAMFLASKEKPKNKQQKAKDFYDVISTFEVMIATPTLSGARKIRSQLSSCFKAGTKIQTINDEINIEDLRINDIVLTDIGTYEKVEELFNRQYSGLLYELEICGLNRNLQATEEHPIKGFKNKDISCYRGTKNKRQGLCIGRQSKKVPCFKQERTYSNDCIDLNKKFEPKWIPINELEINDFVNISYPKFNHNIDKMYINDIISIKNMVEDDGKLFIKNETGSTRSFKPVVNQMVNQINNEIQINEDFMLMVGYFLAEGHISKDLSNICFTFNINEINYQQFIFNYFKDMFGIEPIIQQNKDNSTNVIIGSKIVATLMHEICGTGFNTKYLKDIIMFANPDIQKYLLAGVIRGDGCAISNGYQLVLSNERLINQLFQISLRCGLSPHMYNPYTSTLATTPGYTIVYNHIDKDFINLVNKNVNKINFLSKIQLNNRFWYNGEYYMEIKNITNMEFVGIVYNFEVENTHSYVVNNVSVHNCFIGSTPDNIEGIFDSYKEMGLLSKFGGGIGWDWNEVRCRSSVIDNNVNAAGGTTPWLKITNDIAIAVDQLGCVAKNSWVEILDKVLIVHENGDESIIEMLDNPSNSIREKTIKTFNIDETILYLLDTFGNPSKKYNNEQMLIAIRHYITTGKRENGRESIQNSLNLSKDSTRNLSKLIGKWIENCNFIPDGYKIVNYTDDDLSNFICNEYGDIRCRKTLKPVIQEAGTVNHLNVTMNSKNYKSSRIIYFTWSESKNYFSNIDHKDNNKWNNHFNNLCEKTHSENISDGWKETGIENRVNKGRIRKHLSLGYQLNGKNTINGKNNLDEISIKEFIYKRIPISKVEKNMFAKSFNIETGKIEPKIVEAVHEMLVKKEDQISLNYKDGSYTITSNWHPTLVFKNDKFIYIRADEVINGDIGVDGLGNKAEYIDSTKPNISENYCDLTVKGNNNYFCVTDKKDGISHVIHNTRKGAIAVYLEPWHMDIKEFLDLKKNSGEERLRAHDIFPALWINDLFMERVKADAEWTLFDPYQTPELSGLYGDAFKTQYLIRENDPKVNKTVIKAKDLWKQVLTNYFESGSPFLCFKDTANRANPNSHVGHIRSSNLCTEVFQNTSPNIYSVKAWISEDEYFIIKEGELALTKNEFLDDPYIFGKQLTVGDVVRGIVVGVNEEDKSFQVELLPEEYQKPIYALEKECHEGETAVCNLASINLSRVNTKEDIERVAKIAMNMLDNVVDLNFYPTKKAKDTNLKSRAVGLGVMGEAEMLASKGIMFGSQEHFEFIDDIMEMVSFNAIKGSAEIAVEKGSYPNFNGSAWSEGILPIDKANQKAIELTKNNSKVYSEEEYNKLRESVRNGMRNGYLMAIAPTSSISILVGTTQTIEPIYKKKFFEENMSGLIPVVAPKLSPETWNYYPSAFDIEQMDLIKAASVRQKWIDQGQSTNVFMRLDKASGKYLNDIYMLAWEYGLKSTYYLRSQSPEAKKESDDIIDRSIECMGCQ